MAKHRTRVGLHGRNSIRFTELDYELVRRARIETLKMLSLTDVSVYERLRRENPHLEFIVRLYDDRLHKGSRPSPDQFVAKMVPIIRQLRTHVTKFEIHNEPNHVDGIEGWGPSDQHARSFVDWYMPVLRDLKRACPWARFGFPGLALNFPHRDLAWLDICRNAVRASDWLGCHCYWQYGNMLHDEWGLRFKLYHQRFPNKQIEITEFGDSTPDRKREDIAEHYVRYYQALNRYPYLASASAFIASSPDPAWTTFVWMKEGGEMLPVVPAVGNMKREAVEVAPDPSEAKRERTFPQTGKTVRGAFLQFFEQYGLDFCGYPITDQITEDGMPCQYFQRLALEEFRPGQVRLRPAGSEAWAGREKIGDLYSRIEELRMLVAAGTVPPPEIQDIVDDLPTHATNRFPTRLLSEIKKLVIHHTATSPAITPQRIAQYQVQTLNLPGIKYHWFIAADGTIYQTNRLQSVTDHAFDQSRTSASICFAGNFMSAIPTTNQLRAGGQLLAWLLEELCLPNDAVVGLCEISDSQSPGRQWLHERRWRDLLLEQFQTARNGRVRNPSALTAAAAASATLVAQAQRAKSAAPSAAMEAGEDQDPEPAPGVVEAGQLVTAGGPVETTSPPAPAGAAVDGAQHSSTNPSEEQPMSLTQIDQDIRTQMDAALKAAESAQADLIAGLKVQIKELETKIQGLKASATPPPPARISKPPIEDLTGALLKHETDEYKTRSLDQIETLVIHHSAVAPSVGPEGIAKYHVKRLDWPGIGYHYLVGEDGTLFQGNALTTVSYHAANMNTRSAGVCFLGNFNQAVPPAAQLRSGAHLVAWLLQELDLSRETVKGHKEYMGTVCPGKQWLEDQQWKELLLQEITTVQQETDHARYKVKTLYHYMLFWHHGESWAKEDWLNATEYMGAFQPTAGFAAQDAAHAQYVTIVGGPLGIPQETEKWLIAMGSQVERLAGENEAETKAILTKLVQEGKRFRTLDG